jgi:hypothetical protein
MQNEERLLVQRFCKRDPCFCNGSASAILASATVLQARSLLLQRFCKRDPYFCDGSAGATPCFCNDSASPTSCLCSESAAGSAVVQRLHGWCRLVENWPEASRLGKIFSTPLASATDLQDRIAAAKNIRSKLGCAWETGRC